MKSSVGTTCTTLDAASGERITLAHGEGGRLTRRFIRDHVLSRLDNEVLAELSDAAVLSASGKQLAFTTDSFVVSPIFFPGGDIGSLAVYGTVNDLAVSGARPRWISLGMIIEEGMLVSTINEVMSSIASAAWRANVRVVTGDTKVVPRGAADGLFLNTTGIGDFVVPSPPGPKSLEPGDQLIVSGPIGRHGVAVMTAREQLEFDPVPTSDSAPLTDAVTAMQSAGIAIRCMRDATRGGVTAVLHEWSGACQSALIIDEASLPVTPDVRGVCELLGLDPLHVACEGTMLIAVANDQAAHAIEVLQSIPVSCRATVIGQVLSGGTTPVAIRRVTGRELPLDEPFGAPLPRIC